MATKPKNKPRCSTCGEPATCHGTYEGFTGFGCDVCCGHGCEDGHCEPICNCGADRTGPSAEAHDPTCPASRSHTICPPPKSGGRQKRKPKQAPFLGKKA